MALDADDALDGDQALDGEGPGGAGAGPVLVLLHSGVADRRMWRGLRTALAAERSDGVRVIAPDLRGFGESPMPDVGTAYTDAGDVAGLLDERGIRGATVVGSSLGGRVALELAVTRPDLVGALVLLCAAYRGLEPSAAVGAFGEEEDRLLEADDVEGAVALNVDTWLGPDADDATRREVSAMQRRAFELQLTDPEHDGPDRVEVDPATIDAPTLVVVGERDLDHFVAVGEHLAATMPHATLRRLPWAAHLPALERPAEAAALVARWMEEHPPAG